MSTAPVRVLLVEDSEADARMITRMLRGAQVANEVEVVGDGLAALERLRAPGRRSPDVILLDLNMPRMDGFATLEALKGDDRLGEIPVIVLTSTSDPGSISRSYAMHASAFVTKPMGLEGYRAVVSAFEAFWLRLASLPSVAEAQ
jgi:CheY-like chemotaxis protein